MPLRPGARAWAVWAVGLAAYLIGVLHRTSLGVAGLDAQQRFGIGAGTLASFAVLQLLVYAGLQVPVGLLLDRFGSLRLVVAGALVMASGQALMAKPWRHRCRGSSCPGRRGRRHDVHQWAWSCARCVRLWPNVVDGQRRSRQRRT